MIAKYTISLTISMFVPRIARHLTVNGDMVRLHALHTFIINAHPSLISHVTAIRRLSARLYEARHTKAPFSRYTRSGCHRKFPLYHFSVALEHLLLTKNPNASSRQLLQSECVTIVHRFCDWIAIIDSSGPLPIDPI